jgi:hypothetical protein
MQQNLTLTLGFKGQGNPNAIPAGAPTGYWTLGGYQDASDTQTPKFGVVMTSSPAQADGDFLCGAATISGVASVFTATVSGTAAATGNINIDGTAIAIPSGTVASGAAALIIAASGNFYRFVVTSGGSSTIITMSGRNQTLYSPGPVFTDSNPATGLSITFATTASGVYGSTVRGITMYDASVAENDPAKPNYIIQGAPITLMYQGQMWFKTWIGASTWQGGTTGLVTTQDSSGVTLTNALATPVLGAVVVASNVTGEIGFLASGSSAPTGYSIISATIKSVSTDTGGVMLYLTL